MKKQLATRLLLVFAALLGANLPAYAENLTVAEPLCLEALAPQATAPSEPLALALPPLPTCSTTCSTVACRGVKLGAFCNSGTPLQGRCGDGGTCPADGKVTCFCTTGPPL